MSDSIKPIMGMHRMHASHTEIPTTGIQQGEVTLPSRKQLVVTSESKPRSLSSQITSVLVRSSENQPRVTPSSRRMSLTQEVSALLSRIQGVFTRQTQPSIVPEVIDPRMTALQEQFGKPVRTASALPDCIAKHMKDWTLQTQLLYEYNPSATHIKDALRQPMQVGNKLFVPTNDPGYSKSLGNAVVSVLRSGLGQRSEFTEDAIERLRCQVTNLMQQSSFMLDEQFVQNFDLAIGQSGAFTFDVAIDELASANKQNSYELHVRGSTLTLTAIRYRCVRGSDHEIVGYDAVRVKVTVSLEKLDPEKLLLTEGATTVEMRSHGFRPTLQEVSFWAKSHKP